MHQYSNVTGVPLSVAVFLATDTYDSVPGTISATSLIKPVRQVILSGRVPAEDAVVDILSLVKSRMGTAIHDAIERSWKEHRLQALTALGYPDEVVRSIVINPEPADVKPEQIPVYMEQRVIKEIDGFKIGGKYDFIAEGVVEDFKTTSTFTWKKSDKHEDYQLQGSIYRWLNPEIVTEDYMLIQFFFTDWNAGMAKSDPKYPPRPVEPLRIPLLSLDDTEQYIKGRLAQHKRFKDAPEQALPLCTDKELWRDETVYKYYKDPTKRTRSTKNFDNAAEAYARKAKDGNVGIVVEVPGQVRACKFCRGFSLCSQKDDLIADGSLQL